MVYECDGNVLLKDGEEIVKCKSNRNCEIICKELDKLEKELVLSKWPSCLTCKYRVEIDHKMRCLKRQYIFEYGANFMKLAEGCDYYGQE